MSPEAIVLSEISQPQKNKDCRIHGYGEPRRGKSIETGRRRWGRGAGGGDRVSAWGQETVLERTVVMAA